MTVAPIRLRCLSVHLAVCRLESSHGVDAWMQQGRVWSITRTPDELSVICAVEHVPEGVTRRGPFATFMVEGPLDFALTGIVARLSAPLADAAIPVFVLSTYDTDYVLVPLDRAAAAVEQWVAAGIPVA